MGRRVLSIELPLLLLTLVVAELGEVVRELRTDVVLDWFVSLAPLIWIDASILAVYAFVRLYRSPNLAPSEGRPASRTRNLFVPDLRFLHESAGGSRRWWAAAALAYALVYVILQGMIVVDLSGTIEPGSAVIESPVGYGPGLVWAPTSTFGVVLRPRRRALAPGRLGEPEGGLRSDEPAVRIRRHVSRVRRSARVGALPRICGPLRIDGGVRERLGVLADARSVDGDPDRHVPDVVDRPVVPLERGAAERPQGNARSLTARRSPRRIGAVGSSGPRVSRPHGSTMSVPHIPSPWWTIQFEGSVM